MTRRIGWVAFVAGAWIAAGGRGVAAPPASPPTSTATTAAGAPEIPIYAFREWLLYNNAGWTLLERGDYARAEQKFHAAIKAVWPYRVRHSRLLARTYLDLARVLYHEGRSAEAEPLAQWALTVRENHPTTKVDSLFQGVYTLGLIHEAQQHYAESETLLRRAVALQETAIGNDHDQTAVTLDHLATVCRDQGKNSEAESLYKRVVAIREKNKPETNLDLADTEQKYAVLLRRLNRADEAKMWEARALTIRDNVATLNARARPRQATPTRRLGF
jgi:tetratricopeptide (TPR) repeat protein